MFLEDYLLGPYRDHEERVELMKRAYALHQQGRTYREIAALLSLNKSTVQKYVNEAPDHLELRDAEREIDRAISYLREATIGLWCGFRELAGKPGTQRAFARVALNNELRNNLLTSVRLHGIRLPDLPPTSWTACWRISGARRGASSCRPTGTTTRQSPRLLPVPQNGPIHPLRNSTPSRERTRTITGTSRTGGTRASASEEREVVF